MWIEKFVQIFIFINIHKVHHKKNKKKFTKFEGGQTIFYEEKDTTITKFYLSTRLGRVHVRF